MSPEGMERLKNFLIKHEGLRLQPYIDTRNNVTIGVGHNLSDLGLQGSPEYKNGITVEKAMQDLDDDINALLSPLSQYDWFNSLDEDRQIVVIDMAFMGLEKFLGFTNMIADMGKGDYDSAANEIVNSLWDHEVQPSRVQDDVNGMRTGTIN